MSGTRVDINSAGPDQRGLLAREEFNAAVMQNLQNPNQDPAPAPGPDAAQGGSGVQDKSFPPELDFKTASGDIIHLTASWANSTGQFYDYDPQTNTYALEPDSHTYPIYTDKDGNPYIVNEFKNDRHYEDFASFALDPKAPKGAETQIRSIASKIKVVNLTTGNVLVTGQPAPQDVARAAPEPGLLSRGFALMAAISTNPSILFEQVGRYESEMGKAVVKDPGYVGRASVQYAMEMPGNLLTGASTLFPDYIESDGYMPSYTELRQAQQRAQILGEAALAPVHRGLWSKIGDGSPYARTRASLAESPENGAAVVGSTFVTLGLSKGAGFFATETRVALSTVASKAGSLPGAGGMTPALEMGGLGSGSSASVGVAELAPALTRAPAVTRAPALADALTVAPAVTSATNLGNLINRPMQLKQIQSFETHASNPASRSRLDAAQDLVPDGWLKWGKNRAIYNNNAGQKAIYTLWNRLRTYRNEFKNIGGSIPFDVNGRIRDVETAIRRLPELKSDKLPSHINDLIDLAVEQRKQILSVLKSGDANVIRSMPTASEAELALYKQIQSMFDQGIITTRFGRGVSGFKARPQLKEADKLLDLIYGGQ